MLRLAGSTTRVLPHATRTVPLPQGHSTRYHPEEADQIAVRILIDEGRHAVVAPRIAKIEFLEVGAQPRRGSAASSG